MSDGTQFNPWIKDPNAVLDYDVDWSSWLGADTLSVSAWAVVTGTVVIDTNSSSTTVAKVWLSGGTLGEDASVRNRVTTAGGRVNDRTLYFKVREL